MSKLVAASKLGPASTSILLALVAGLGVATGCSASSDVPGPASGDAPKDETPAPGSTGAPATTTPPVREPAPPNGDPSKGPDASVPDPPPPAACTITSAWKPGSDQTVTLSVGGQNRSYLVHVGKTVTATDRAPLVVNIHGLNNSPQIQVFFSNMSALADTKGFIVAYPQGISASFNAGTCCGAAAQSGIDDVGFLKKVVADVQAKTCVDDKRIFATGFSNGGFMSNRLACEAADVFAAVAPVSGASALASCNPSRPVPLFAFHGTSDPVVSYNEGKAMVSAWVTRNGCKPSPERTTFGSSSCDEWSGCTDDATVKLCSIQGGSHLWPGAAAAIPATAAIWEFFEKHPMR